MKQALFLILLLSFFKTNAQEKPEIFTLSDVAYPILTIKKSPSSKYLFLTLAGGRFLLYDVSKEKLNPNSVPLWKNFEINGFELGGDAEFSDNEQYALVSEQNAMYAREKLKIKPFKISVVALSDGKVIYEADGLNSAQFLKDNETLLLVNDEGVATYNIRTKVKGVLSKIENCEVACLNNSEDILAVSYDPASSEFISAEGAGKNKKEVKNAVKHKKLIAFYQYPSMTKTATISEEIDVVFRMQFTRNDSYLIFFSRTGQAEHTNVNILNGMDKANDLNQFQRIRMDNFKVDNLNFIHQTSEQLANCDINLDAGLFAYGDNKGFFAGKREVVVVDFANQNGFIGKYTFQGRAKTRNLFSTAFAILNESNVLVANGLKLSIWNFMKLPDYVEFIEPTSANAILDGAMEQLDTDLQSEESSLSKNIAKKKITGLFLFNITIQKNGEVVSIFALSDEKTNIANQNALKDILLKYKFDVTVPKNERLKFTYTFNIL